MKASYLIQPKDSGMAMSYIQKLWRGDVPLVITFWVWNFLLAVAIGIILGVISWFVEVSYKALLVVYLPFYAFLTVAVWRSANKYTGKAIWAVLAQVVMILGWVRHLVDLFILPDVLSP